MLGFTIEIVFETQQGHEVLIASVLMVVIVANIALTAIEGYVMIEKWVLGLQIAPSDTIDAQSES